MCALAINIRSGSIDLVRMQAYRTPGFFVCLSAFLLALGTYLAIVEVPVRITSDPTAADQYDLMRAYGPLGFALWISAFLFLIYGIVSGVRKPSAVAQSRKPFLTISLIVAVTLGALTLISTFLPWVIAEKTDPFVEIRGVGTFYVGQYHSLTGVSLITGAMNRAANVGYLVFMGIMISVLHVSLLTRLEKERTDVMRAFLILLGGACIAYPVAVIYANRVWWVSWSFGEVGGAFSVTFISPGIGLLIAAASAAGLIACGIIVTIKLARQREHLVNL